MNIMKNTILGILMLAFTAIASAEGPWLTSIEEGVKKAKAENKLVMIEFTGSDWCPPCKMMAKAVFTKEEFLKKAQESYVLVKLDMPNSNPELKAANTKLMQQYNVSGVPTILLFDADGKEFNRFTATAHPKVDLFLKHLAKAKRRKDMI